MCLHNFPRFLQEYERPDGKLQDLAATDILRTRELGVPRYNEFRRLLHLKPAASFDELTDNPEWAAQIERVYDGDIEAVDMTVGMGAEPLPKGFAFSDTAFRIFVLMASRRLNSDRFFTTDFTPQVYTEVGMDWIDANDMRSVLLRHYPGLRAAMRGSTTRSRPGTAPAPSAAAGRAGLTAGLTPGHRSRPLGGGSGCGRSGRPASRLSTVRRPRRRPRCSWPSR